MTAIPRPRVPSSGPKRSRGSLIHRSTDTLMRIGRWRRQRAHKESTDFANAFPPRYMTRDLLAKGIPEEPPNQSELLEGRYRYFPDKDIPEVFARAWLWTLALHDAVTSKDIGPRLKGVRKATYGFVQSMEGVRLAAIFYVGRSALMQAAPLFIKVDGYHFPIVIRPKFKDLPSHLDFQRGVVTCRARLDGSVGVLTAAHVAAENGDKSSIRRNAQIACVGPDPTPGCQHRVLAADPTMDAVIVEDGVSRADDRVIRATPVAGFFPIEVRSPAGTVPGWIVEISLPQGVVPGQRGRAPNSPALLLSDIRGEPGWSGSMVYETMRRDTYGGNVPPQPYCMFVGIRELHTGALGRLHMLRQHEIVWGLELLDQ